MNKEEHICARHEPNNCLVANYQYRLEQAVLNHLLEIYNKGIKDYEKIKENKNGNK